MHFRGRRERENNSFLAEHLFFFKMWVVRWVSTSVDYLILTWIKVDPMVIRWLERKTIYGKIIATSFLIYVYRNCHLVIFFITTVYQSYKQITFLYYPIELFRYIYILMNKNLRIIYLDYDSCFLVTSTNFYFDMICAITHLFSHLGSNNSKEKRM